MFNGLSQVYCIKPEGYKEFSNICPENVVFFLHLQVLIRLDFIMGSATLNG